MGKALMVQKRTFMDQWIKIHHSTTETPKSGPPVTTPGTLTKTTQDLVNKKLACDKESSLISTSSSPSPIPWTYIQPNQVPQTRNLITLELSQLCSLTESNILHHDGLEAALSSLADHNDHNPMRPPIQILRELMSIVLKNNIFEFNGDHYLKLQGMAMGTKMAPSYANLFTGRLEPKLQAQAPHHIQMWKRYIDDIFIIWTGSDEDLKHFMEKN